MAAKDEAMEALKREAVDLVGSVTFSLLVFVFIFLII